MGQFEFVLNGRGLHSLLKNRFIAAQSLKGHLKESTYGIAEAMPDTKREFFSTLLGPAAHRGAVARIGETAPDQLE